MTKLALTCLLALLLSGCLSAPQSAWTIFPREADTSPSTSQGSSQMAPAIDIASEKQRGPGDDSSPTEEELLTTKDFLDLPSSGSKPAGGKEKGLAEDGRPPVNFEFPLCEHARIDEFVRAFTDVRAGSFQRRLERSGRFVPLMREIFAEEGLPEDLVYLAMVESGFQEHALSWAQASGPWQFIESTGRRYGLKNDAWRDERRDPVKSTRAAASHLRELHRLFGDWHLALAAYNAGSGRVQKAIRTSGSSDFWTISQGGSLHCETQDYVPKFLASLKIVREPEKYGFEGVSYQAPLAFDTVTVPTTTDLAVIARLCDTSIDEIKALNPELKRWCTPPGARNYRVRIPSGKGEGFKKRYAALPADERVRFKSHKVIKGETLKGIAGRYDLSTGEIMELNHLRDPRHLMAGATLLLPLPEKGTFSPYVVPEEKPSRSQPKTYLVRQGDNLYRIARSFAVSEDELRTWNGLGRKGIIRPGQKLVVAKGDPPKKPRQTTEKPAASAPRQVAGKKAVDRKAVQGRKVVYQVRSGDSFWKVSRQFKVATQDILKWNNLSERHVLKPGESLTLHLNEEEKG